MQNYPISLNTSSDAAPGRQLLARWLWVALLFCFVLTPIPLVNAQQSAILRCRFNQSSVAVGNDATLFVEVVDVANLYGYEMRLHYDLGHITFVDADANQEGINLEIGNFLSPDFVLFNVVNTGSGEIRLAMTQLSPNPSVSGSGRLAQVTIRGQATGLVSLHFSDVVLSDPDGKSIPITLQNCNIDVVPGNSTSTPTPTPTSTPTPSITPTATATVTGTPPTPTPTSTPDSSTNTGSISGSVFLDTNEDGNRDPDEEGVNALVLLYRLASEQQWADLTDDDGNYSFANLSPGRYFIESRALDDVPYSSPINDAFVTIAPETVGGAIVDFGLQKAQRSYYLPILQWGAEPIPGQSGLYLLYIPIGQSQSVEKSR